MTSTDDLAITKPTGIPREELSARRGRLLEHLLREQLSGYVLFDVVALAVTARLLRGRGVPVPAPAPS